VTSGRKLTKQQVDAVLRLAGVLREDGEYLHSQTAIAVSVDIHRRTVSRCLRDAAVREGKRVRWQAGDLSECG
jgi:hypothetical protein